MKSKMNFLLGCMCVGLGILGAILPVMPSTCFFILAAYFFGKSSKKFETWVLTHKKFGPSVRAWRETRSIPMPAKCIASLGMTVSLVSVALSSSPLWILVLTTAVILPSAFFIWTRPH